MPNLGLEKKVTFGAGSDLSGDNEIGVSLRVSPSLALKEAPVHLLNSIDRRSL